MVMLALINRYILVPKLKQPGRYQLLIINISLALYIYIGNYYETFTFITFLVLSLFSKCCCTG
ncbi:hypothetical protein [Photorhabdus antumapuensis]|uniref:hypothetical protein n=1 Tax=Photorhabdus antumapuensis TaxID=2862867 RepID=UPI0037CB4E90